MSEFRSLLLRANRMLGASLVENNLIQMDDLESANERLLELVDTVPEAQLSLLGILIWEMKVLEEEALHRYLIEEEGLGLIDLGCHDIPEDIRENLSPAECRATWTMPFDRREEFHFIATTYYLSAPVRRHWEKKLGGPVIWYATSMNSLSETIDAMEKAQAQSGSVPGRAG